MGRKRMLLIFISKLHPPPPGLGILTQANMVKLKCTVLNRLKCRQSTDRRNNDTFCYKLAVGEVVDDKAVDSAILGV